MPKARIINEAVDSFSLTENLIFYGLATILCISTTIIVVDLNDIYMIEIPSHSGTLTEGIIGIPRFINPLLALSDSDRDMTTLIYSGLLRATPDGTLVPDLAQSYSISPDGLTYTFVLKPNIVFHDNKPITTDDVLFTVQKARDPGLKSPKRPTWEGVVAKKINDREVQLILKQPYSPFLENATLGILPKHIWSTVPIEEFPFSQYNVQPVGSGPYQFKSIERNSEGVPLYYRLEASKKYTFGTPYIKNITLRFYQNNAELIEAYKNDSIDSLASISPKQGDELNTNGNRVERTSLPRVFGIFFNQNQATVLANKEVRQALDVATDKQAIVDKVLEGYGIAIKGPIPPGLFQINSESSNEPKLSEIDRVAAAKKILDDAKWKFNEQTKIYEKKLKKETLQLAFSISTSDAPELKNAAEMVQSMWTKIGAKVDLKIFDIGELNQNVIRPRKYDALLFGEIIGRDLDLFAFWHSSQRNDPGLNIALYTNAKVDRFLDNARSTPDIEKREETYPELQKEIENDIPAIFIYSPDFLYVVPKNLRGFSLGHITIPAERFLSVSKWYVDTERVWKIFAPK
ncbi:MAG: hypothetical protein EXS46_03290 [Candidatus Taylorbacteria bacterium]|nr:hypothetical protein [Candidatus Taylorbacteria bacterium]